MEIIGSANGPTSIYTTSYTLDTIRLLFFLLIGIIIFIILIKLLKILPNLEKAIKIYIKKNKH